MLRVWDVLSGKPLLQIPTRGRPIGCAAALWGDRVATGHNWGGDGGDDIQLWSLRGRGGACAVLRGHTSTVLSLSVVGDETAVTPSCRRLLASGSGDCSVRLWNVETGRCTAVLRGHTGYVRCLAAIGSGKLLSGSDDRSLRVWSITTGACLAVVLNAPWSRSACTLGLAGAATGSYGGSVQRWEWDDVAGTLMPGGAALQLEHDGVAALVAVPAGSDGGRHQRLLAGLGSSLRVLGSACTTDQLQQQAVLAWRATAICAVTVMQQQHRRGSL